MGNIISRLLDIKLPENRSAFLWGPRKVGKTYWINHYFKTGKEKIIDLLKTDVYAEYISRPSLLRERWNNKFTIIDEIQKVPALLDEIHWLIENKNASFLLTGSSARKLKRGHANMLGGRAWRFEMGPLSVLEIKDFDLESVMTSGLLPPHYLSPEPIMDLRSYISDYLKEEIAGEALIQNIPSFSEFLTIAAITNSELLNYTNIARESGVSAKVVRNYFQILEDTMLGFRLKPWTKTKNRRMILTEKFYFFDVGVANFLAKRTPVIGSAEFGKSFEHYILMELLNFKKYKNQDLDIHYWRTSTGIEVDFILGNMELALEVKGKKRVHAGDIRTLRALRTNHKVKHCVVISLEKETRKLEDGITIEPWRNFIEKLWSSEYL